MAGRATAAVASRAIPTRTLLASIDTYLHPSSRVRPANPVRRVVSITDDLGARGGAEVH
jgi:hypothetical protein